MEKHSTPLPDHILARAMALALDAAREHEGATAPNPPVGCTLLDQHGEVLATAAHCGVGQPHAEALAIKNAKNIGVDARIHTIVVTLEPCNHHGRTPPCTEAILSTTAQFVVAGTMDLNPGVKGGGLARLATAGLGVRQFGGSAEKALASLIAPFAKAVIHGLPWVTVKQAFNAEGNMIPPVGRKTFTSPASLLLAHQLRRRADAIFTGSGTVLADQPLFTVRHAPDIPGKRRELVLFDRRQRIPASYIDVSRSRGFDVQIADDLEVELRMVVQRGGLEVLVEAGPTFTSHVLASTFWDECVRITQTENDDHIEIIRRESH